MVTRRPGDQVVKDGEGGDRHLEDRLVVPVGVDPAKLHSQSVHKKIDSTSPRFQMFTEK